MRNATITAVAATIAAAMPSWALAQQSFDPERYGPHMMWWGGGWAGMFLGPLFMILVLALVIAFAVLLVRWLGGPWQGTASSPPPQARTPLDILKERFARGEIDQEEYERRRRVLGE